MKVPAPILAMWEKTPPKQRQIIVVIFGIFIFFVVIAIFTPKEEGNRKRNKTPVGIKSVLTETNSRELTIENMGASITHLKSQAEKKDKAIEQLRKQVGVLREEGKATVKKEEIDKIKTKLKVLERENQKLAIANKTLRNKYQEKGSIGNPAGQEQSNPYNPEEKTNIFDEPPVNTIGKPGSNVRGAKPQAGKDVNQGIMFVTSKEPAKSEKEDDLPDIYIPAGSIIQGVLITGMDAQTSSSSIKDPMPALIRVQDETIMPNLYRSDIRECFILTGGYGDLSTERAFLRTETLSCIHEDGSVLEMGLEGYAAGEDGKAGVRGRLVTKNGQLIAQTMLAGFLQGWAGTLETENTNYLAEFSAAVNGKNLRFILFSQCVRKNKEQCFGWGREVDGSIG